MPVTTSPRQAHRTQRSAAIAALHSLEHAPQPVRRSNQLFQERVMTLFGLSAADPRGNLEGVAALTCTDLH